MLKRMLIMLAGVLLVFGGIFGWKWFVAKKIKQAMASGGAPVVTVSSVTASNEVWHPALQAVGTLRAVQGTDVNPQAAGQVTAISFESGQAVKKGELLVQLDISVEQAQLRGLEAEEDLARIQLKRVQDLSKTQIVAQSDLDQAEANFKQAQAAVASQKELIARKTIRAPFDGMAGIRQVNLGDYLDAGAKIVTLQSLNPIYVDFALPQEQFSKLQIGATVKVTIDAYPDEEFTGHISAINSKVSEATRNIPLRATLTNAGLRLRPGMFAEVSVELPQTNLFVTLPATAITYNPYGDSVFVIQSTNVNGQSTLVVRRVFVQTGPQRGTQIALAKGVQAGQEVVTAGQMKLQEGSRVRIDNSVSPPNEASVALPDEH